MTKELIFLFITGITIFSFQQILVELWIKPYIEFKKTLQKIDFYVFKNKNMLHNVRVVGDYDYNKKIDELNEGFRDLASEFVTCFQAIPLPERFWLEKVRKYRIISARKHLIRLSNMIGRYEDSDHINRSIEDLEKDLHFKYSSQE